MNANELMIGDWVISFGAPHKIVGVRTDSFYPYIKTDMSDTWYEEGMKGLLEPIPLTPDILEKNGLNKGTWGCSDRVCYSIIDGAYQLALVQELPSYYCNIRTVSSLVNMNILIRYVHELQHALRLAGINKEIVL